MPELQRTCAWDVMSAEESAEWSRLIKRFNDALDACKREIKREQELEATRREIETLPATPPVQEQ